MIFIFIYFSLWYFPPDSKRLPKLPSFSQQCLAGFLYGRPWHISFRIQRSERQLCSWKVCDGERETCRMGTVSGSAAKPCVLTGTSIIAISGELLSSARKVERKLTLVLLLICCLGRKSANTDCCIGR